jgi:hypothetical protein
VPEKSGAARRAPGAHDGDRARAQDRGHAHDFGTRLALVAERAIPRRRVQVDHDVNHLVVGGARALQTARREDVEHVHVLLQDLGAEAIDPLRVRVRHEALKEERRDTAVLVVIIDHEGDSRR